MDTKEFVLKHYPSAKALKVRKGQVIVTGVRDFEICSFEDLQKANVPLDEGRSIAWINASQQVFKELTGKNMPSVKGF